MFCTKCGLKNDDDALFCAGCGAKIVIPKSLQVEEKSDSENIGYSFFQQEKKEDNTGDVEGEDNARNVEDADNTSSVEDAENTDSTSSVEDAENTDSVSNAEDAKNTDSTSDAEDTENMGNIKNVCNVDVQKVAFENIATTVDKPSHKFSVKRFIFSALLLIAAIASCMGIIYKYLELSETQTSDDKKDFYVESFKGYEIIKEDGFMIDSKIDSKFDTLISMGKDDVEKILKEIRLIIIISAIAFIVFAIIEFILLVITRRRWGYVLTMIFSIMGIGSCCGIIYLWCFELLDKIKELYQLKMLTSSIAFNTSIKLTANIGMGLIITLISQAIVFICSIVLITCKNRPKVNKVTS